MSSNSNNSNKKTKNQTKALINEVKSLESSLKNTSLNRRGRRSRPRTQVLVPGPDQTERMLTIPRRNIGLTSVGRAWLRNYLNPCGEQEVSTFGIPDGTSSETACKHSRMDPLISIPEELKALMPDGGETSDWWLGVIIPPWIDDAVILVASGFEPSELSVSSLDYGTLPEYPSWAHNETPPVLTTTVWASRVPNVSFPTGEGTSALGNSVAYASQFRNVYRGMTLHMISDNNHNRGSVTAAQFLVQQEPNIYMAQATIFGGASTASDVTTEESLVISKVAYIKEFLVGNIAPSSLVAADGRAYQADAKQGVYMPIYTSGEMTKYYPYVKRSVIIRLRQINDTNAILGNAQIDNIPQKVTSDSQNMGVVWFKGLDVRSTIQLKYRHAIQVVVNPESPWSADTHISTIEDSVALDTAKRIQNLLPQAYPACYNDWGFLGNIVKGLVSKIPVVGGLLTNLVDPVGRAIGGMFGLRNAPSPGQTNSQGVRLVGPGGTFRGSSGMVEPALD